MYFEDERIAIEKRMFDNWPLTTLGSTVNVYPENTAASATVNPFVQLFLVNTDSVQMELGDGSKPVWFRVSGFVDFSISLDVFTATTLARKITDEISGIFLRKKFSYGKSGNIVFQTGVRRGLGSGDGAYREAFRMPFYRNVKV